MNWQQIEGDWEQIKGDARATWGELTDEDLVLINGRRELLVGKLMTRYGIQKEQAQPEANEWAASVREEEETTLQSSQGAAPESDPTKARQSLHREGDRIMQVGALLVACSLCGAAAAGCGASTPSPRVSAIALSPAPCLVRRSDAVQMSARATRPDGTKDDVTSSPGVVWSSADTSTATVSPSGTVVGVNPGVTTVSASFEGAVGHLNCAVGP